MSSGNGSYPFHFHGTHIDDEDDDRGSDGERYDIHPMELVVQSVLGKSLESLSGQLQTLHESQIVLIARLKVIEEKLKKSEGQLTVDIDVKHTEERIMLVKKRLQNALATLTIVEQRIREKIV